MTCIVGVAKNGKVYIGADSLGSNGFTKEVRKECKVFTNGDFLIGGTTSFRMLDLLKWKFNPPTVKDGDDLHKFMVVDFVESVRNLFTSNGFSITSDDWKSGEFLVGVKGRLFRISGDFHVSEHDYVSCGSGEYHAVGCLYNSKLSKPKEDIIKALECAENFVVSVSRPFTVLCI